RVGIRIDGAVRSLFVVERRALTFRIAQQYACIGERPPADLLLEVERGFRLEVHGRRCGLRWRWRRRRRRGWLLYRRLLRRGCWRRGRRRWRWRRWRIRSRRRR